MTLDAGISVGQDRAAGVYRPRFSLQSPAGHSAWPVLVRGFLS